MARPISSDIILVNRDGTDYKTTYTEANPSTCELPLLPGPPVIALGGQPQTKPAEVGDSIVIVRAGEGPDPSSYQWQRGLKQDWTDIPGETGIEYTVSNNDDAINIRLQQTFDDDSALYSNEIVIAELPPKPWVDFPIIVEVTVTGTGVFSTSGFDAAFVKDTLKSENADEYVPAIGETMIYAKRDGGGIGFTGSRCDFEFGALTNTQQVNYMQDAFKNCTKFTGVGIEYWDTSNVTSMNFAFGDTYAFNTDISGWDVSNVTNMGHMFFDAFIFNTDISGWDVGNVTNMHAMFYNAEKFSTDLTNWNVSNVTTMGQMFLEAALFNSDISGWDVSNVTNMAFMFNSARAFNSNISNWDVSNVANMNYMFSYARAFNQDISNWDVDHVTGMDRMLNNAQVFNQNLTGWCVQPEPTHNDFKTGSLMPTDGSNDPVWGTCPGRLAPWDGADAIYHVITTGTWDIHVSGSDKIYNLATQAEVSTINTAGEWIVTGASTKFNNSSGNWDFGDLTDTSNVTNMSNMFEGSRYFNSDISSWDVGNVTDMYDMFNNARAFNLDISNWEVGNVTNMSSMLSNATTFNQDLTGWCVDPEPIHANFGLLSAMPTDGSNDPVWGTCP